MEDKRYRVVPPLMGAQLVNPIEDRIYIQVPAERPDHPRCYEGEWVCSHSLCPVQIVRLRVRAFYHQHLPRLRCPLCLRQLDFRHWLTAIALQEVPSAPAEKKKKRRPRQRKLAAADAANAS